MQISAVEMDLPVPKFMHDLAKAAREEEGLAEEGHVGNALSDQLRLQLPSLGLKQQT